MSRYSGAPEMIASICEILRTEYPSTKPVSALTGKKYFVDLSNRPRHATEGGAGYRARHAQRAVSRSFRRHD